MAECVNLGLERNGTPLVDYFASLIKVPKIDGDARVYALRAASAGCLALYISFSLNRRKSAFEDEDDLRRYMLMLTHMRGRGCNSQEAQYANTPPLQPHFSSTSTILMRRVLVS